MSARRRIMPWILGLVVLVLVALATHVPRLCRETADGTAALSDVSVVQVVPAAAPDAADPCGDATADLDAATVCPTRLDVTDPVSTRPATASIPPGGPPAGGSVIAGTPATTSPRPPMGLAVANLAVTRI